MNNKPTKRLYIKHDKLDNLFQLNGIGAVNDLLENGDKDIHELLAESNGSNVKANASSKQASVSPKQSAETPSTKTKNQPFKLSSILSATSFSIKTKTTKSLIPTSPTSSSSSSLASLQSSKNLKQLEKQKKNESFMQQQKLNGISKKSTESESESQLPISMLDSLKSI